MNTKCERPSDVQERGVRRVRGQPELKARVEQLTPVLADRIRRWRDDIVVTWSPEPSDPVNCLNLTLVMSLPNGVTGSVMTTFTPVDLADEGRTRRLCRDVWADLLGVMLLKQGAWIREDLLAPSEV